tara:strand:- start:1448 stop:1876 length:429 start_codon:yes stop_codon:yes gene_type:complete
MAHFAKLGINGKVIAVHVVNNSDLLNGSGVEDETVGQQFLERLHGWPASMWIQTSYNTVAGAHTLGGTPLRGTYAGVGMTYDEDNNIFRPKQPYPSWVLNTTTASWHSPIGDQPDDLTAEEKEAGTHYVWNEDGKSWDKTTP